MTYPAISHARPGRRWLGAAMCAVATCLLVVGCGAKSDKAPAAPAGIEKIYDRGPVHLVLRTSAESITTADTLELTLSATLEDGYSVAFPTWPAPKEPEDAPDTTEGAPAIEKDPEFTAAGYEDAAPTLTQDNRVSRSRTYRLEPFLEGSYAIPSLTVTYWKDAEGEDKKSTLDTDPLKVTVTPIIGANDTPEIKAIVGPVDVQNPVPWVKYTLIALLLIALAGAAYWYTFIRVPPPPPPVAPIPPHVRALSALEAIQRAKLVEQGLYKEYYIRVSDVLRHYMEDEFQLRAPERTTEEFLAEIQNNAVLGLQEQLLLRSFLRHCDLVKFAKAEPSSEEISDTFATCEKFIVDSEAAHRAAKTAAAAAAPLAPIEGG